jgi:hypothetical protein
MSDSMAAQEKGNRHEQHEVILRLVSVRTRYLSVRLEATLFQGASGYKETGEARHSREYSLWATWLSKDLRRGTPGDMCT